MNGADLAESNGQTTGITNKLIVPNLKARLVSFETPVSQEPEPDTTQDASKVVVSLASRENVSVLGFSSI